MRYVIIILLTVASGYYSGLILGLMSLNPFELERKKSLGDKQAKIVYPLRKQGNLLLVSLVFGTTVVNAILTVYLGHIATGLIAVIVATLLIMIFGTLLPQALFSRVALKTGAASAPFVKATIWISKPICMPIAWLLDRWLGQELPTFYSKQELIEIVKEHEVSPDSAIEADEERIVRGALSFGDRKAQEIMVPRSMVASIEKQTLLTREEIDRLKKSMYSRFPVYENNIDNIIGVLYAHDLINTRGKRAGEIAHKKVNFVNEAEPLDRLLNAFIKSRSHLFIVVNEFSEMVGVISLEDVIESIIGRKIVDEFDIYDDVRAAAMQRKLNKKPGNI